MAGFPDRLFTSARLSNKVKGMSATVPDSSHFPLRWHITSPLLLALLVMMQWSLPAIADENSIDRFYFLPDETARNNKVSGKEWLALDDRIGKIETSLHESPVVSEEQLTVWEEETSAVSSSVDAYVEHLNEELQQLNSELEALGEAVTNEPDSIAKQRQQVSERKGELEGMLVGYRLLQLHSKNLLKSLQEKRQKLITERFFVRGPSSYALLKENPELTLRWLPGSWNFMTDKSGLQAVAPQQLAILAVMIVIAMVLGGLAHRRCRRWIDRHDREQYQYAIRLVDAVGYYAPHLLLGGVAAIFSLVVFDSKPYPFVWYLGVSLPLFFAAITVLRLLLYRQGIVTLLFSIPERVSRGITRGLRLFLFVLYVGMLIFNTQLATQLSEPAQLLSRDIYVFSICLSLLWSAFYLRVLLFEHGLRGVFGLLLLVLLITAVAEVSGYRNFAYWALRAVFGTTLLIFFAWIVTQLLSEFFSGLRSGKQGWQSGFRHLLGYTVDESMPWVGWLHALVVAVIWFGLAYNVLLVWGLSNEVMSAFSRYVLEGFQVGSLTIVPFRIVIAVLIFAFLLAVSDWLRGRLEGKWLKKSRMERGTREALVTISGYVGVALAVLIALGVAGVQFTNLAIIAGALSVGIGFGLQNIVNNFVSGLILLFERPVKTGDWIVVGGTEGHVKRISIRSTLIQTFDRADVIVPNSELISGQVTNWMLHDARGRIRVPIGVAYGSDTKKVEEILLRIANEHPNVITNGSMTPPKVLFMDFGDSSLNFELRAFIKNIDERLQVASDINFAIDAAFREEGIEIPFPQRDIHLYHPRNEDDDKRN
jgi:potassium-dependent mechanosensitive channel